MSSMNERKKTKISKFLALVLRYKPEQLGLSLDDAGWVDVDELLRACVVHGRPISRGELEFVVETNSKRRFAFSPDGRRIRASQGHSIEVELGYEPAEPPDTLYHGTVAGVLPKIREHGLLKMQRHHVHLSVDRGTAQAVGSRRGQPVLLEIDARAMREAGHDFFCTPNGVWLTDTVPSGFIRGLNAEGMV